MAVLHVLHVLANVATVSSEKAYVVSKINGANANPCNLGRGHPPQVVLHETRDVSVSA